MTLSPNWRTTYKRYSVWALTAGAVVQVVWAAVPNPPIWAILLVNGVIAGLGLVGSYLAQPEVTNANPAK